MSLDRVPGPDRLYISGIFALRRRQALKDANITHVISALRLPLEKESLDGLEHLVVEVNDLEEENIIGYLPACIAFIQQGLDSGGGVLVHCAMGKSRSASIIVAYLMSNDAEGTPSSALAQLRQARPFAEPNDGFMSQLELFNRMKCPTDLDSEPDYQRWLYQRAVKLSNSAGVAPDPKYIFKTLHKELKRTINMKDPPASQDQQKQEPEIESSVLRCHHHQPEDHGVAIHSVESVSVFRCRRCRKRLATSNFVVQHKSKALQDLSKHATPLCGHVFVDPLSWMKSELEKGSLSGRLECPNPKCKQNVGKYAWQGMKCSCGEWIVPGISLMRSKLDEVKEDSPTPYSDQGL